MNRGYDMSKLLRATAWIFALALLLPSLPAQAVVTVDQVNLADHTKGTLAGSGTVFTSQQSSGFYGQMQSVTSGLSGTLARLDLQLYVTQQHDPGAAFRVELYNGEPGTAGPGVPAGVRSFTMADLPTLAQVQQGMVFSVDLASLGFQVTAGSTFSYAVTIANEMVTRRGPVTVFGYYDGVDEEGALILVGLEYAGGFNTLLSTDGAHQITAFDRGFRTWVDVAGVPEPTSWALILAGFGMAGLALRRERGVSSGAAARG